eukprot:3217315-Pyramimonas_sp.AAC.1
MRPVEVCRAAASLVGKKIGFESCTTMCTPHYFLLQAIAVDLEKREKANDPGHLTSDKGESPTQGVDVRSAAVF